VVASPGTTEKEEGPPLFLERVVVGEITDIRVEGREDAQPLRLRWASSTIAGKQGSLSAPRTKTISFARGTSRSIIGTGTPMSESERSTKEVFPRHVVTRFSKITPPIPRRWHFVEQLRRG